LDFGESIQSFTDEKASSGTHTDNEKLSQLQQTELNALLSEFGDIFQDTSGKTNMCTHHITLVPGSKPVASTPYRLHPEKAKLVEQEIDQMLKMGIITRSDSPWDTPIVNPNFGICYTLGTLSVVIYAIRAAKCLSHFFPTSQSVAERSGILFRSISGRYYYIQ